MTKQEFIAKYEGWFSYTHREELKKQMESDLDAVFQALRQQLVVRQSEQLVCDCCEACGCEKELKICEDCYMKNIH